MSSLEAVAYVSSAAWNLTDADLESLLASARERNLEHRVSGVLLYHDGTFLQYFEGPPEGVAVIYERVQSSKMHRNIIELMHAPIETRSFPDWSMGFTQAQRSAMLQLSNAKWHSTLKRAEAGGDSSDGLTLLLHFWHANTGQSRPAAPGAAKGK